MRGEATRPAITFLDTRAAAEAAELAAATGIHGWALGPLPAALWLERHEPEIAARTRWYLTTWEWLAFRLTGEAVAPLGPDQAVPDPTVVAEATGLHMDRRPPNGTMGGVVGALTETAGRRARPAGRDPGRRRHQRRVRELPRGRAAGAGRRLRPGRVRRRVRRLLARAGRGRRAPSSRPAPLAGLYSVGAAMAATGRALDWFRDAIVGGDVTTERLLEEAAATPPGADGVVFLPYLAGERSPIWDPTATGVFAGLTLSHGRGHLARAIIEASALAIRHVATPMLAAGVTVTAMRACGGPARSDAWNQVKADVTGFPVLVPDVLETAVLGSAILGAVAIGANSDVRSAVRAMTRIDHRTRPAPRIRRDLRPAVRRVHRAVSGGRAGDAAARSRRPRTSTAAAPRATARTRRQRYAAR